MWLGFYFGIEPRSIFGNWKYRRRLKKAVARRIAGHSSTAAKTPGALVNQEQQTT